MAILPSRSPTENCSNVISRRVSLAPYHTSRRTSAVFATFTHVFNNKYCFRIRRQTPAAFVSGRTFVVVINNDIAFSLSLGSVFLFWLASNFIQTENLRVPVSAVSVDYFHKYVIYIFFSRVRPDPPHPTLRKLCRLRRRRNYRKLTGRRRRDFLLDALSTVSLHNNNKQYIVTTRYSTFIFFHHPCRHTLA